MSSSNPYLRQAAGPTGIAAPAPREPIRFIKNPYAQSEYDHTERIRLQQDAASIPVITHATVCKAELFARHRYGPPQPIERLVRQSY